MKYIVTILYDNKGKLVYSSNIVRSEKNQQI